MITWTMDPSDVVRSGPRRDESPMRWHGWLRPRLGVVAARSDEMSLIHMPTGIQVRGFVGSGGAPSGRDVDSTWELEKLLWEELEMQVGEHLHRCFAEELVGAR